MYLIFFFQIYNLHNKPICDEKTSQFMSILQLANTVNYNHFI